MEDRLKRIGVVPEIFFGVFKCTEPITIWCKGLPADAELVRWYYDYPHELLYLVVRSAEFDEVSQDTEIPLLDLTIYRKWAD